MPNNNTRRPLAPLVHRNEEEHRRQIAARANAGFPKDGTEQMTAPARLQEVAFASLPDASLHQSGIVFVPDGAGGASVYYSDGSSWTALGGASFTVLPVPVASGGTGSTTASAARTALGVAIGSDVQAYDGLLAAIAALATSADKVMYFTGADAVSIADLTAFGRTLIANASAADTRTDLGLGSIATENTAPVAKGGTGATTASGARSNLGLGTIATQAASSVALTGGDISGTNLDGTVNGDGSDVDEPGFRGVPSATHDAAYTLVLGDAGKLMLHTSGSAHAWTIPQNSSVAFPVGTAIAISNTGAGNVTLTRDTNVSLRQAGDGVDANKTFAQYGLATLVKVGTNDWVVSGAGIS